LQVSVTQVLLFLVEKYLPMYEYIIGKLTEVTPAAAVVENQGMGYFIHISLNTYSQLSDKKEAKVFLHQVVREDAQLLFGFSDPMEREVFRLLIAVSGVGPNTARMMLSSMAPQEIRNCIVNENVKELKGIKGIGAKTAQRIIIDLKDKMVALEMDGEILPSSNNTIREEALSALVMLGFQKSAVDKVLQQICKNGDDENVESLIKKALKKL